MAYIHIESWTSEQVTDWLKGLGKEMFDYVDSFTNNQIDGQTLLTIRPYELEELGMKSIGHQEILFEGLDLLRNFHYNFARENLQFLALQCATSSESLMNQLRVSTESRRIETEILYTVSELVTTIKAIISWIDRAPFRGQYQYDELRNHLLKSARAIATSARRDIFVENLHILIRGSAEKINQCAEYVIKEITDPMNIQPASLNLVTIKKKETEYGFQIVPSYHGVHLVSNVKQNTLTQISGLIEEGDEIVQINYQTVVGWRYENIILHLQESPPDVVLTLKKRPRRLKMYGQIYVKPYRLPSKKIPTSYRWGDNIPTHVSQLFPLPALNWSRKITEPVVEVKPNTEFEGYESDNEILTPTNLESSKDIRIYMPKPRPKVLHRRNTICTTNGIEFKDDHNLLWKGTNQLFSGPAESPSLRDKSVSFGYGLEMAPRPTTCSGILSNGKSVDLLKSPSPIRDETKTDELFGSVKNKIVRFESMNSNGEVKVSQRKPPPEPIKICKEPISKSNTETFEENLTSTPIEMADDKTDSSQKLSKMSPDPGLTQAVNTILIQNVKDQQKRGRLDKSHSTPAYGVDSESDSDVPPAIEPRLDHLQNTPPAPPPRPRKPNDSMSSQNSANALNTSNNSSQIIATPPAKPAIKIPTVTVVPPVSRPVPAVRHFLEDKGDELVIPIKSKTLTLKKKNSMLAKRRNITLKSIEATEIQGHLYRRAKDKVGVTYWDKLYFVLVDTYLYGFRTKEASRAKCLIFLSGCTVSLATEVHSKSHAFKIYNQHNKTLYFAAESDRALKQWMDYMNKSTIAEGPKPKELYSESESDEESATEQSKNLATPSPQSIPTKNSLKKSNSSGKDKSESKYHLGFGSLKKFTKNNLPFTSNKNGVDKKGSSDIPIPTSQFRRYRKVPGNVGMQLGSLNVMASSFGSPDTNPPPSPPPTPHEAFPVRVVVKNQYTMNSDNVNTPTIIAPSPTVQQSQPKIPVSHQLSDSISRKNEKSEERLTKKPIPLNYIHASNPNLVEFSYQGSPLVDFPVTKKNSFSVEPTGSGIITLMDLMLQKQEEDAQEMYSDRVHLGVVKKRDSKKKADENKIEEKPIPSPVSDKSKPYNSIQDRKLPDTPDTDYSFSPNDPLITFTRTQEIRRLRDLGYEYIPGDDDTPEEGSQGKSYELENKSLTQDRKHSIVSTTSLQTPISINYPKKKLSLSRITDHKSKSKTMSDKGGGYSVQLDHNAEKKYSGDYKDTKTSGSFNFAKLSFNTDKLIKEKEKKLLGSPRLHRSIFGRSSNSNPSHQKDSEFTFIRASAKKSPKPLKSIIDHKLAITSDRFGDMNDDLTPQHTPKPTLIADYNQMAFSPYEQNEYPLQNPETSSTIMQRRKKGDLN